MKKKLKLVLGIAFLPVAYCLYALDRLLSVVLPHMNHPKFIVWCDVKYCTYAIIRLIIVFAIIGILSMIL